MTTYSYPSGWRYSALFDEVEICWCCRASLLIQCTASVTLENESFQVPRIMASLLEGLRERAESETSKL